jgi:hypothetical protein
LGISLVKCYELYGMVFFITEELKISQLLFSKIKGRTKLLSRFIIQLFTIVVFLENTALWKNCAIETIGSTGIKELGVESSDSP